MCGLVGTANSTPQADREWLARARDTLTHRGPDDAGEWWSDCGRVGLAHRRLSIRDLSPLGHQPMHLAERGLSVIFNGEIYNFPDLRSELERLGHSFRSQSDTEVLLAAYAQWGRGCLRRLNGMFALALFDDHSGELLLARDRVGEKPLFYRIDAGTIHFGSELKALFENRTLPRRIDHDSLDCLLGMGFVPGARCMLEGYSKLPPGHYLRFCLRSGRSEVCRYWQLPTADKLDASVSEDELLLELERLLDDAVARQLVADVPVGVLLSGGVDSSIVTALAARHRPKVRTFSIAFPGHGRMDESPHARLVARHFGTEHTELAARPADVSLLPTLARQFDEPIVDSSMVPTWLVCNIVREHCTVALGGDGGDELFGGYDHYVRLLWLNRRVSLLPAWGRRTAAMAAERLLPTGTRGRNYLRAMGTDLLQGLPLIASYFDATERARLLGRPPNQGISAEEVFMSRVPESRDLVDRATRMDFENFLAEDILVKLDRASMLNSLEVRSPLLDHRVIEFAFGRVPSKLKATVTDRKSLLKRLAGRLLPPEFDRQRKQGFSMPLASWLRSGPFREFFWETLMATDCTFDRATVGRLLAGQDRGRSNSERLFALVLFELWRKAYGLRL